MAARISQSEGVDERKVIKDNPLVSIITPVLNGIKYLEMCVQTVLAQSYPYIEHVLVDGGSCDGTLEMLTSYRARYPHRIRFISEPDKGAVDAWNKGLKMAKGDILGWLGSDDTYEPDAVLTVVEFFRSNPDAYFAFGDCNFINERNEIIRKYVAKDFDLREAININCYIPTSAAFYKREVIEKVGLMDPSVNACDRDYWIRVGKVFQICRIEKVLSAWRMHKDSISCQKGAFHMYARECYVISRRHGGRMFSGYGVRYFMSGIVELLQPILGPYPFIPRFVSHSFIHQVARKIKNSIILSFID